MCLRSRTSNINRVTYSVKISVMEQQQIQQQNLSFISTGRDVCHIYMCSMCITIHISRSHMYIIPIALQHERYRIPYWFTKLLHQGTCSCLEIFLDNCCNCLRKPSFGAAHARTPLTCRHAFSKSIPFRDMRYPITKATLRL